MHTRAIPVTDPAFAALKSAIESHARLDGYYLIRLVDISRLRAAYDDAESLANEVMPLLDDQPWPSIEDRPRDVTWRDQEADAAAARAEAIEALAGGARIGHTRDTIAPEQAAEYVDRFFALFEGPMACYTGLGLGDPNFTNSTGVAIIGRDRAGVLWVVESD